jgi:hypothetical protein
MERKNCRFLASLGMTGVEGIGIGRTHFTFMFFGFLNGKNAMKSA